MSIYNRAEALHLLAREQNKLDQMTLAFDQLMSLIEQKKMWVDWMDSPMIDFPIKEKSIESLKLDSTFSAFLKLLAKQRVMYQIYDIYEEWAFLARQYQRIAHVHLITAKPLTQKQEEALKVVLSPKFQNQTITFHTTVDPKLLGGVKVVYNGQSLDRSIARELSELESFI
jgi:F-type H+-transporting ATPase subunit delta